MKLKIFTFFAILFTGISFAQDSKTIHGKILDPESVPLPGAEVKVVGKSLYDITDFEGSFTLENVQVGDRIRVTYMGFENLEFPITQSSDYVFNLREDASELDEVVVVGYGTQRKQDLTGAISQVSSEEIVKQPSSTATQALQGKVAGVNIINSDAPGATPTVTIRGLGTALGGRDPLYVVDGTPVNDITNISPSSIESIDFLKDASSAAIYGVRAANGVIIVTTKKGKRGEAEFRFNSFYGVKDILNQVQMANASQYVAHFNEENAALPDGDFLIANQPYDTNWYDEMSQLGFVNNNVFNISGGGESIDYFFAFDNYEEEGILPGQIFRRSTITTNNTFKLFDNKLKIIQNLNIGIRNDRPKPFSSFNTAYRQSPLVPVFYETGRYGGPYYNRVTGEATYIAGPDETIGQMNSHGNPVAALDFHNQKINALSLQGSVTAELAITNDLTFSSRFGARKSFSKSRTYNPNMERWLASDPTLTEEDFEDRKTQFPDRTQYAYNSLAFSSYENYKYNWDNFLTYKKNFGAHNINLTVGGSKEQVGIGMSDSYRAYDVPDTEQYWSLNHASDQYDNVVNQTYFTPTNFMSYFGRAQYDFDKKYYFTGTLRRDGSSAFKKNSDYWGTFPSIGLGWALTEEEFLSGTEGIDFLKLRGSWGELGNANVPLNTTQIHTSTGSGSQNYVLGPDQRLIYGAFIGSPAQNLSWEIVNEWSLGLDYELLNYRLSGSIDLYHRTTENTILRVEPLLNSNYSTNFYDHGAEVVNKGIEFAANWNDKITSNFSYNLGVNFSYNDNEIASVKNNYEGQLGGSLNNGRITKRLAEGQPLGAWWMYDVEGVWQTQEEIDNNASLGGARVGHLRYVDQNNDGAIDERDKVYSGSYIPSYNFGLSLGMNYKQFDFSVDSYGAGGNKVYNGLKSARINGENITEEMFNKRWTGPNSTNIHPGADRDAEASTYYLEDGDFLRINNITLGYTLPETIDLVSSARIYVSAQNPFMFTGYSGFTPELNSNGDPFGTTGIELAAYPNIRTLLVGLNIQL